jgi:hypothetical protein
MFRFLAETTFISRTDLSWNLSNLNDLNRKRNDIVQKILLFNLCQAISRLKTNLRFPALNFHSAAWYNSKTSKLLEENKIFILQKTRKFFFALNSFKTFLLPTAKLVFVLKLHGNVHQFH